MSLNEHPQRSYNVASAYHPLRHAVRQTHIYIQPTMAHQNEKRYSGCGPHSVCMGYINYAFRVNLHRRHSYKIMIYKQQFIKLISLAGNHLHTTHKKGKIFITFPPNYIYFCDRYLLFYILYFDLIKKKETVVYIQASLMKLIIFFFSFHLIKYVEIMTPVSPLQNETTEIQ